MLEAVRRNSSFTADEGALKQAETALVEQHYPWIADLQRSKESIAKWVANRVPMQAIPALNEVLPMGLTPEMIIQMTAGPEPKVNLTEQLKRAA